MKLKYKFYYIEYIDEETRKEVYISTITISKNERYKIDDKLNEYVEKYERDIMFKLVEIIKE